MEHAGSARDVDEARGRLSERIDLGIKLSRKGDTRSTDPTRKQCQRSPRVYRQCLRIPGCSSRRYHCSLARLFVSLCDFQRFEKTKTRDPSTVRWSAKKVEQGGHLCCVSRGIPRFRTERCWRMGFARTMYERITG